MQDLHLYITLIVLLILIITVYILSNNNLNIKVREVLQEAENIDLKSLAEYSETVNETVSKLNEMDRKITKDTQAISFDIINKTTTISSDLIATSFGIKKGDVTTTIITNDKNINGNTIIANESITSHGIINAKNGITVDNGIISSGNITSNSIITANAGLLVKNGITVDNGIITAKNGLMSDDIITAKNGLIADGIIIANAGLTSSGIITAYNGLTVNNGLTANGIITANAGLTVNNSLTANGGLTVNNVLTANGGMTTTTILVNGNITSKGLTINNDNSDQISTIITSQGQINTSVLNASFQVITPMLILNGVDLMKLLKSQSMNAGFCITSGNLNFPLYLGSFTFIASNSTPPNPAFDTKFINGFLNETIAKLYINKGYRITVYNTPNTATSIAPVLYKVFENTDQDVPKLFNINTTVKFDNKITPTGTEAILTASQLTSVYGNIRAYKAEWIGF